MYFWKQNKMEKLLLHSCCAPCSTVPLEMLAEKYEVTFFYYNPNIENKKEYEKRYLELKKYLSLSNRKIKLIKEKYKPKVFLELVTGLETEKEGAKRCYKCYELRIGRASKYAKENNYDLFGTTLSTSPHKNINYIHKIGKGLATKYELSYLDIDFKKNDGFKKSVLLSKENNLYRQNFCGCIYSKRNS